MNRVSVCLPVYNGADFLDAALASVAAQNFPDIVVLASDNASTDGSLAILEHWRGLIRMDIAHLDENIPMQMHFNRLLDRVETEFYMLLCHDDMLASAEAIARAVTVMDTNPDVVAVYCDLSYVNEQGRDIALRCFGRSGLFSGQDAGVQSIMTARNMYGIPLLVRTSALGSSRYDHRFYYIMDVDLSWEISGDRLCWHIPERYISNRYRKGNATWSVINNSAQEYIILAEKHGVHLGWSGRLRLVARNFLVRQLKQAFRVYVWVTERVLSGK